MTAIAALPPLPAPGTGLRIVAALAAVWVIWGSTYLGIAIAVQTLPPLLMAGARFIISGLVLMALVRLSGAALPTRQEWGNALIVGTLLLGVGNGTVCVVAPYLPSGFIALIISVTPLWLTLMTWAGGEGRPTPRVWGGIILGMLGVIVLVVPRLGGAAPPAAIIAVLLASAAWAWGSFISRRRPTRTSLLMSAAAQQVSGGLVLALGGLVHGEFGSMHLAGASTASVLAFIYLTLFGSLVGFVAYTWLLRHTAAAVATSYAYVNPVVACILGSLLNHEVLETPSIIGGIVVVAAVALVTSSAKRTAP